MGLYVVYMFDKLVQYLPPKNSTLLKMIPSIFVLFNAETCGKCAGLVKSMFTSLCCITLGLPIAITVAQNCAGSSLKRVVFEFSIGLNLDSSAYLTTMCRRLCVMDRSGNKWPGTTPSFVLHIQHRPLSCLQIVKPVAPESPSVANKKNIGR